MDTIFYNVTIAIGASPKDAYDSLTKALSNMPNVNVDFETDTYSDDEGITYKSTSNLFPELD